MPYFRHGANETDSFKYCCRQRFYDCTASKTKVHGTAAEKEELKEARRDEAADRFANRRIRILVAKPALDGHDRGVLILAKAFRDAGMEVLYAGLLPTPEKVAQIAVDEDVDVVALSLHNSAHMDAFSEVKRLLEKLGAKDIQVVGGGIIPPQDRPKLEKMGITGNFGPGTPMETIIDHIKKVARRKWEMNQ